MSGPRRTERRTVNGSILIVDDDDDTSALLQVALRKRGFDVQTSNCGDAALGVLRSWPADVVVTDVQMPGLSGIELCRALRERHPNLLTLVLTGVGDLNTAVEAIRAGAFDFIVKPVKIEALGIAVARALEHLSLKREVMRLRTTVHEHAIDGIAGKSRAIGETVELVRRVAPSDATVLITGESGTGKELVARALHNLSPRSTEAFVAVNCAAMPAPLLESELFGHVRGAFTDAKQGRAGLFVQAGAGTIFLDEIGEMPIEMQVKLLRVLQERRVRPVGSDDEIPFEARVVTATNRNLDVEVEEKRFREDLYYRVNVVAIPVPPLRARASDILLLAQYFLKRIAARIGKPVQGINTAAARLMMDYDWPGNVRELENCMERAVALCRLDEITLDDLPEKLQDHKDKSIVITADSPTELITLAEMERRYVRKVLHAMGDNKTQTARILGIDRRSLYRRLEPSAATESPADPTVQPSSPEP
jgi:DNA-binding NtrC family response regulator